MLRINEERFLKWMDEQAKIGATVGGGLSRPALSEVDLEVRAWFQQQIVEAGLAYDIDGAGNQTARLPSANPSAKTLVIGSHLDSVVDGGRFDGALGMLAAFEAMLTIKEAGIALPFHLEVINFTDEEGTMQGLLGSSAFTSQVTRESLQSPRGGRARLVEGMERAGLTVDSFLSAGRDPETLLGYIEVHIEQGTRLERAELDIGVVTSIVGIRSAWLTFQGEAAHAGTSEMPHRKDAFWGTSAFAQKARQLVMEKFHPGVVNFGMIELKPGAFNIVPAQATLAMEFRHGDLVLLDAMRDELLALAQEIAETFGLALEVETVSDIHPSPMTDSYVEVVEQAAERLGLSSTRLMSFAGHDAQSMARVTNSVMFFVPSVDGISHNPKEYTKPEDCVNAANVMLQSVLVLGEEMGS